MIITNQEEIDSLCSADNQFATRDFVYIGRKPDGTSYLWDYVKENDAPEAQDAIS